MGSKILISNGSLADPETGRFCRKDIYIEGRLIKDIADKIEAGSGDINIIDARGMIVMPGLVDMHVHLRDPGFEEEETIESGAEAALAGGITSMACMPNTSPAIDSPHLVKYVIEKADSTDCSIYPVAAMTKGIAGKEITEMGLLSEEGAVAFSDDGRCVSDARLMFEIMRYSVQFGKPLVLHEEEYSFSGYGLMHEGKFSTRLGLEGISRLSDDIIIQRDIMLAGKTGARIHITHVSTSAAVDMIRRAKKNGVPVTCDVTSHHLFFNDSFLEGFNTNLKVKPPLRSRDDQMALIEGAKDGTIDAIISDHAPHLDTEKNTTFRAAEFGTIGLETLFASSYTKLCRDNGVGIDKLVRLLTLGPSSIIGINAGKISRGKSADITVADPGADFTPAADSFRSRSKNSAFIGQKLYGKIKYTVKKGKIVYESGSN
jgi:dihydroorotase